MDGTYMFSLYKIYISRIRHVSPREQAKCHKTLFFMNFISLNLSLVLFTLYDGCMLCCEFFFCCGELKHDTFAYAARDSRIFMLSIPYMM